MAGDTVPDVSWFNRKGEPMSNDGWSQAKNRIFQMRRSGRFLGDVDALVVVNGTLNTAKITLPESHGSEWVLVADTSWPTPAHGGIDRAENALEQGEAVAVGGKEAMEPQSMAVYFSRSR